jgi:hypothetical protein
MGIRMAYGRNIHAILVQVQDTLHHLFTKVNSETASIQKSKIGSNLACRFHLTISCEPGIPIYASHDHVIEFQ